MYIQDLVRLQIFRDSKYEFINELDKQNTISWLKTVDAFANTKGGVFFIGVEDKSYKLIGFEQNEIDKEKLFFYNTLKEHFDVISEIKTELIEYQIKDKSRYILKINVFESETKPVILMYQGLPCIYKRRDGYTSPCGVEELISMTISNKTVKFDSAITDIKFDINDFNKLSKFFNEHTNMELTEKLLSSINFFNKDKFLTRGALLFKDDYTGEDTSIVCSIYEGFTRGDDRIISSNRFKGNLIDDLEFMLNFIKINTNHGFIKKDTYRIDIDAYPIRSVFESLINALAHRDYFIKGSDIFVDLFKNRLVISSPGSIFKDNESKTTYQLDKLISSRRNELISNVFVLCKVIKLKGLDLKRYLKITRILMNPINHLLEVNIISFQLLFQI